MRLKLLTCVASVALAVAACGDGGTPPVGEPSGEYFLASISNQPLPYSFGPKNLSEEYDEVVSGSIRILSRGRLFATAVVNLRSKEGALLSTSNDTLVFKQRRAGDQVILELSRGLAVTEDTLEMVQLETAALRALTERYKGYLVPNPLFKHGLYVRTP